jgi:hypothetical protein
VNLTFLFNNYCPYRIGSRTSFLNFSLRLLIVIKNLREILYPQFYVILWSWAFDLRNISYFRIVMHFIIFAIFNLCFYFILRKHRYLSDHIACLILTWVKKLNTHVILLVAHINWNWLYLILKRGFDKFKSVKVTA